MVSSELERRRSSEPPAQQILLTPSLLFAFWLAICSGNLYVWGDVSQDLAARCTDWTTAQLASVYSAGQLGCNGLGLIFALLYNSDRGLLKRAGGGPVVGMLYSGVCLAVGLFLFLVSVDAFPGTAATTTCGSASLAGMGYLLIQAGCGVLLQGGLFYQLAICAPDKVGLVTGILTTGSGLSAFVWSVVYKLCFRSSLVPFFLICGLLWTGSAFVFAAYLKRVGFLGRGGAAANGGGGEGEGRSSSPSRRGEGDGVSAPLLVSDNDVGSAGPVNIPASFVKASDGGGAAGATTSNTSTAPSTTSSVRATLCSVVFLLIIIQFACVQSVGSGFFLGNVGIIVGSLGYDAATRGFIVQLQSLANAASRIIVGKVMDFCEAGYGWPFDVHFIFTAGGMALPLLWLLDFGDQGGAAGEVLAQRGGGATASGGTTTAAIVTTALGEGSPLRGLLASGINATHPGPLLLTPISPAASSGLLLTSQLQQAPLLTPTLTNTTSSPSTTAPTTSAASTLLASPAAPDQQSSHPLFTATLSPILAFMVIGFVFGANSTIIAVALRKRFGASMLPLAYNVAMVLYVLLQNTLSYSVAVSYESSKTQQYWEHLGFFGDLLEHTLGERVTAFFYPVPEFCTPASDCFAGMGVLSVGLCVFSVCCGATLICVDRRRKVVAGQR